MRIKRIILAWFLCISLVLSTAVLGYAYSNILTFGDSLSDNGSADGFGIMRFSDGSVWVEYLADPDHLNVQLFDIAIGGATTGLLNPAAAAAALYVDPDIEPELYQRVLYSGLNSQVDYYLGNYSSQISGNTLVTVWAGANDLFQGWNFADAADNVAFALDKLADAGFQNFLVMNLPDIGATPQFSIGDPSVAASATLWSQAFNMDLAADLLTLEQNNAGANFYTLDIYNLFTSVAANPQKYGFNDISEVFWDDGLHPSTLAHSMIADYAASNVPEPTTIILVFSGLLGLAGLKRKYQI